MTRAMATIRTVLEIKTIRAADKVEAVRVGGWWVVCKKGEFSVGQSVVYFEIDSWIPETLAPFLFKGKEYQGIPGARLRTIRLRKQLSQGLIMSLEACAIVRGTLAGLDFSAENTLDMWLGILKWEPPFNEFHCRGEAKGIFPPNWRKTDQERCQNILDEIEEHYGADTVFEVTIKLDGSSMSVGTSLEGEYTVASRNVNLKIEENPDNTFIQVARESVAQECLPLGMQISGELVGVGIQGNREKIRGHDFFVYDVFNVAEGTYLSAASRLTICAELGLRHVPVLHAEVTLRELGLRTVDDLLEFAEGASLNAEVREGVVFKAIDGSFSFKAIANSYLLKEK